MKLGVLYLLIGLLIFFLGLFILAILVAVIGMMIGYDIIIMENIDNYKLSWKERFFKPFVRIEKREDPCWFKIARIIMICSFLQMGIIAYLNPDIPKEVFSLIINYINTGYKYIVKKVEDFHYQRNEINVKTKNYMNDL